jgi:hypothetical protein
LSFYSPAPSASKDSRSRRHKMSTGTNELSAWRAAVVRIINDKVTRLVPTGTLTYAERDKERWGIFAAEREGDDTALMGYLVKYSPHDSHVLTYPDASRS